MWPGILPNRMNTLNLIKLSSIFLLSGILASQTLSEADQLLSKEIRLQMLGSNGKPTLEDLKAIFEDGSVDAPPVELYCLRFLRELEDPEAVKYALLKSANTKNRIRASDIRLILAEKIYSNSRGHLNLEKGEPGYEIVVAMLESIKGHCYAGQDFRFPFDFGDLICEGNVPLLEKFVEAGFKISPYFYLGSIKRNKLQTIKFLAQNGFNLNNDDRTLPDMVASDEISLDDFKFLVDRGLRLECDFCRTNWLVIAIETGRFDLFKYICEKGVRLSKGHYLSENGETILELMVQVLAKQNAFAKYQLMLTGQMYGGEALEYMPKELVLQIIKPLYEAERETILQNLYHA